MATLPGAPHGAIAKQHDSSIMKVIEETAPVGPSGEKYLASGRHIGMRLWRLQPHVGEMPTHTREYEVVGYVISGRASLFIGSESSSSGGGISGGGGGSGGGLRELKLEAGMSYCVPRGVPHRWHIETPLVAVEGTSPVSFVHDRDARVGSGVGAASGIGAGMGSNIGMGSGGLPVGGGGIDTSGVKVYDTGVGSVSAMPTVGVSQSASDIGCVSGVTPFTSGKIVSGTGQQPGIRVIGSDAPVTR